MRVELIYDRECPNVIEARAQLLRAFAAVKLAPSWIEWDRNSKESPSYSKRYGSPTILVDGKDCVGLEPSDANSCRIYEGSEGAKRGIPPLDVLITALKKNHSEPRRSWLPSVAMVPSIGIGLLPSLGCPACWPAYAGLLSAAGLGFLVNSKYLFYVTALFLVVGVGALAFGAKKRRGYLPALIGILGAIGLMVGKFYLESNFVTYSGIFVLLLASFWNAWPRKTGGGNCPSCIQAEQK